MFKMLTICLSVATLLTSSYLPAEEGTITPKIKTTFHNAESIHIIPRLKYLDVQDPGFNKVVFHLDQFPKNKEVIFEVKRFAK